MPDTGALEVFILSGKTHTFRSICKDYFGTPTEREERQVDKAIQRLRKAGKIAMKRNGRSIEWTATPSQAVRAA